MSRINIRKHRYHCAGIIGKILLPKLYRHVDEKSDGYREWVDTNPENGELLHAFRQSKEDLIRAGGCLNR